MYLTNLPEAEVLLIEAISYADFKTKFELPVIVLFSVIDGYNCQCVYANVCDYSQLAITCLNLAIP